MNTGRANISRAITSLEKGRADEALRHIQDYFKAWAKEEAEGIRTLEGIVLVLVGQWAVEVTRKKKRTLAEQNLLDAFHTWVKHGGPR